MSPKRQVNHNIRKHFNTIIYNISRYAEIALSIVILLVIALAGFRLIMEVADTSVMSMDTEFFSTFLSQALSLVVGVEFVKMLCQHSAQTVVEVLMFATARQMVVEHLGPAETLLGVLSIAVLFAISGLICWCGISQVISNSVSSAMKNAFHIPPLYTTIFLVVVAAIVVLRKNATVHVLDVVVPIMAGCYLLITLFVIIKNIGALPSVFQRIFEEAFGLRQVAAGGFGAVLMNGIKRGLFSNEAGSGSAPCAAAAADVSHPAKAGLMQAFGVFIDTILICTCSALLMLLAPSDKIAGLQGMDLLQSAMQYHLGEFGVIFIAVILFLFSFSTFIGILFYARSNVAYLFGDNWLSQTAYKILALVMLFIGGLAAYTFVWDLGDVGIGLMTIFNMIALIPLSGQAIESLKDYERNAK